MSTARLIAICKVRLTGSTLPTRHGASPLARLGARAALPVLACALAACANLPERRAPAASQAFADAASTRLGRVARAGQADPALSGFRLLPEAGFAFDARIALARRAEKSLDVQYYLIQNDAVGGHFLRELRAAAARGVRVRLLVDDLYTGGEDELFASFAASPNVELRIFNPLPSRAGSLGLRVLFSLHEFGRVNHRMHNKLFIADASLAIVGGRNIADEYFMRSPTANFLDLDVMASGPVVGDLETAFDRYWNSAHAWPIADVIGRPSTGSPAGTAGADPARFDALAAGTEAEIASRERDVLGRTSVAQQLDAGVLDQRWAPARVVVDAPDKMDRPPPAQPDHVDDDTVTAQVVELFAAARRDVQITSPYFLPGKKGMAQMREGIARGGRVVLFTNSLGATDEPLVYWRYTRYREDMLRAGVTIFEFGPQLTGRSGQLGDFGRSTSRLHAKVAIIDDRVFFIGSMNLDPRSARLNTEIGLVVESPELVAESQQLLRNDRFESAYRLRLKADGNGVEWIEQGADGLETIHPDEPNENALLRLKNWFVSPFVAEGLL